MAQHGLLIGHDSGALTQAGIDDAIPLPVELMGKHVKNFAYERQRTRVFGIQHHNPYGLTIRPIANTETENGAQLIHIQLHCVNLWINDDFRRRTFLAAHARTLQKAGAEEGQ